MFGNRYCSPYKGLHSPPPRPGHSGSGAFLLLRFACSGSPSHGLQLCVRAANLEPKKILHLTCWRFSQRRQREWWPTASPAPCKRKPVPWSALVGAKHPGVPPSHPPLHTAVASLTAAGGLFPSVSGLLLWSVSPPSPFCVNGMDLQASSGSAGNLAGPEGAVCWV